MKILQAGNKVTVRSDGTRTSVPKTDAPASKRRDAPVLGSANRGNKAAMDAAGMKNGGMVGGKGKGYRCGGKVK